MIFGKNISLYSSTIKTILPVFILTCIIIFMAPTAHSEEHHSVPVVLFTNSNVETLPYNNSDILNITNGMSVDIKNIYVSTTSGGEVCAVIYDNKDNNKHSAYFITTSGNPLLLNGTSKDLCFNNSDTLHHILGFSSFNMWLSVVIFASSLALLLFSLFKKFKRHNGWNLIARLEGYLEVIAYVLLVIIGAVSAVSILLLDEFAYTVNTDTLFTASATIMGLAVFGSAFTVMGQKGNLAKGIAYALIPAIVVQLVFMLSLVRDNFFPAEAWIIITGASVMLMVPAILANNTNNKTDDNVQGGQP